MSNCLPADRGSRSAGACAVTAPEPIESIDTHDARAHLHAGREPGGVRVCEEGALCGRGLAPKAQPTTEHVRKHRAVLAGCERHRGEACRATVSARLPATVRLSEAGAVVRQALRISAYLLQQRGPRAAIGAVIPRAHDVCLATRGAGHLPTDRLQARSALGMEVAVEHLGPRDVVEAHNVADLVREAPAVARHLAAEQHTGAWPFRVERLVQQGRPRQFKRHVASGEDVVGDPDRQTLRAPAVW
mmetsp:Transcript_100639/g.313731  ORF Transcript_100639/g.313731 Transcript_100639/m.313731 type:complete len:245 (-) Transcript_100639:511-1245(-)